VQEALFKMMEGRTSLVIAHRLSTIQHCDEICVLRAGRIIERGTHAELYAASGQYRRLCDMQAFGKPASSPRWPPSPREHRPGV